jgi:hypothetical protein
LLQIIFLDRLNKKEKLSILNRDYKGDEVKTDELISAYRNRIKIERAFLDIKQLLELRPISKILEGFKADEIEIKNIKEKRKEAICYGLLQILDKIIFFCYNSSTNLKNVL